MFVQGKRRRILLFLLGVMCALSVLAQADVLRVVGDWEYPPYEFLDEENRISGILTDVWDLWSQKTGIAVEYALMPWDQALASVRQGTADIVGGIFPSAERELLFDFSQAYQVIPTSLFFRTGFTDGEGFSLEQALVQNVTVGVVQEDSAEDFLDREFPGVQKRRFSSHEKMVDAAIAGELDAFIGDVPVVSYLFTRKQAVGLFQVNQPVSTSSLCAAVARGNHELLEEVNRGFSSISREEMEIIVSRWTGQPAASPFPWKWLLGLLLASLAFLGLFLTWNQSLKARVRKVSQDFESARGELERQNRELQGSNERLSQAQSDVQEANEELALQVRENSEKHRQLLHNQIQLTQLNSELQLQKQLLKMALGAAKACTFSIHFTPGKTFFPGLVELDEYYGVLRGTSSSPLSSSFETWVEDFHPQDRQALQQALKWYFQGDRSSFEQPFRLKRVDGSFLWVLARGEINPDASGTGLMLGILVDFDELKRARNRLESTNLDLQTKIAQLQEKETQLKEMNHELKKGYEQVQSSHERLQLALWAANEVLWDWDVCQGGMYLDREWFDLHGFEGLERGEGFQNWYQRIHPDDLPLLKDRLFAHLSGETPFFEAEYRIWREGQWEWIRDRGAVLEKDEDGKPLRMIGTHQNITYQKEREEELTQARDRAEEANIAKQNFLANISHEIRTPLNGIIGWTRVTLNGELGKAQRENLQMVENCSERLLKIVNDILDLSRIEAKGLHIESRPMHLHRVFQEAINAYLPDFQEKELALTSHWDDAIPERLLGDPARIGQVFSNVLSNALKFTPNGEVDVSVKTVSREKSKLYVQFSIRDTGIGIDPDSLDKIFGSFTQEDDSMTRPFGGTGLGLAISKRLVEAMGGRIWVSSAKNVGSTFHFSLPFGIPEG
ncbi:MAG TPA: transporter substrate-binding domain-containing protein [Thermotogota bacterium]|nr:transporter substrate-binding domain-containing protein [Thermotogota bacterium]HRW93645.1 transporter substrate-binding domain-containing protein [Thermotogota bacterium]